MIDCFVVLSKFSLTFKLFKGGGVVSKIEKVPGGIRGEKSSKDMASSRN